MTNRRWVIGLAGLLWGLTVSVLFGVEPTKTFLIDGTRTAGPIKPLHGVNNSPITWGEAIPAFLDAGIPYTRLHDTGGAFGGTYFVDIPNIFPDPDADPNDPASYDFAFTDAYLKGLNASGTKIFYRLGVTIENHYKIKAYRIHPPKDMEKFAQICAGIIRHYNQGWADGFHYGIEYWEIWNEPENPPMWTGSQEEYFELYRITANELKRQFPELKIGGYAGCGFYAVTRPNASDFFQSFVPFFEAFLTYITSEETKAPLDFYSWHLYTDNPEEIAEHAKFAEQKLAEYGLTETENIFDEWNYINGADPDNFDNMKEMPGATFVASAFCLMQNSPIDKAMYYDALPARSYGGLFYFPSGKITKTYKAFWMFNKLYQLGESIPIQASGNAHCYALAATACPVPADESLVSESDGPRQSEDGSDSNAEASKRPVAVFLVNNEPVECLVTLQWLGIPGDGFTVTLLDQDHFCEQTEELKPDSPMILPPKSVVLLEK